MGSLCKFFDTFFVKNRVDLQFLNYLFLMELFGGFEERPTDLKSAQIPTMIRFLVELFQML